MPKKTPKNERIAERLRAMIKDRVIAPGDTLPTELELSEMYRCSRGTARRAVETLAEEGLVVRKQGSGTYVRRIGKLGTQGFIGLITPGLLNTEILRFFHEFTLQSAALGYSILLEVNTGTPTIEQDFVKELARRQVAGVIKFPTMPEIPRFEQGIRYSLRSLGLRHVVINDFWGETADSNHLQLDERAAVEVAVEHLVSLGHRRIAWADTAEPNIRERCFAAFREALRQRDLALPESYRFLCHAYAPMSINDFWPDDIVPPTAIVTPYDGIVRRFIEAVPSLGLCVPTDLSLVSLNGQPVLSSTSNEFTCASSPVEAMVSKALELLLHPETESNESPVCHYLYPPKFLEGMTSAPPLPADS